MKTHYLFLILMLPFLFSCEGDKIDFSIINRSINVNARIEGIKTRASNDTWDAGDAIGIYMISAGQPLSAESVLAKNAKYTTEGGGAFNPATVAHDVKFPIDGTPVDFVAYYPHGTVNAAFEYPINVSDQSNQAAVDLLYSNDAVGLNKESPFVDLSFSHQLSKIIVNLKTIDESALIDPSVTIKNSYTRGVFSLADQSQKVTTNSRADIEMKMSSDGVRAEAIVIPTENLADITFEIKNGLYGYVYNLSSAENITQFEPGYRYTFTITLDTREPLSATAAISPWLEGPGEEAEIEKAFEIYIPVGAGTQEDPYTMEDAQNILPENNVWVKGYIVGYYGGTALGSFSNDVSEENNENIKDTALALAASPDETTGANTFPIQLPTTNNVRENLNLKTNPLNLGKEVKVRGNVGTYYGAAGMPSVAGFEFISPTP